MKKALVIAVVLLLACSVAAMADATNWLLYIRGTDTAGLRSAGTCKIGWFSGKTNGLDTGEEADPAAAPVGGSNVAVAAMNNPEVGLVYANGIGLLDYRAPYATDSTVPKNYYIAYGYQDGGGGPISPIKLTFTAQTNYPFPYDPLFIEVKWATGSKTFTNLDPIPTTGWTLELPGKQFAPGQVPDITVTVNVPEPGSLLALGTGLVGLAGFAIRRRRR